MNIIRSHETRLTETPNASMRTLVSPTLGGTTLSMWTVQMEPGAVGPAHVFDVDQIWTVQTGGATVRIEDAEYSTGPGDTMVLPAGRLREIHAHEEAGLAALVVADGRARASLADGTDRGVPPWIS